MDWPWLLALALLVPAALMDATTRRVPNGYWLLMLAGAVPVLLSEWGQWGAMAIRILAAGGVATVAWLLWWAGQVGGADAKALMVLGLLLSPVGYWSASGGFYVPVLDALLPALAATEAWRRVMRWNGTPFLVTLLASLLVTAYVGNLLAWPLVQLAGFL